MPGPRLSPLPLEALDDESRALIDAGAEALGFVGNDGLTMARVPGLLPAISALISAAYRPGLVAMETKRLVALMTSSAAGCTYCQRHARFGALRAGIDAARLEALWTYAESGLFSAPERAALEVARRAALQPGQVADAQFAELRRHYSEDECAEIVAVIALFGFLNRWNEVLATEPETLPAPHPNED